MKKLLAAAACIIAGQALAQSAPPPPPPIQPVPPETQRLDQMAAERNAVLHRTPIIPSYVPPTREVILQPNQLWVCKGAVFGQPVFSAPRSDSKRIGLTLPQVATSGGYVNGFAKVLHYNGKIGWVSAAAIHPYYDPEHPHVTCSFSGVRPDGRPVFGYN